MFRKNIETSRLGLLFKAGADKFGDFLIDQAELFFVAKLLVLLDEGGQLFLLSCVQEIDVVDFLALHAQQLFLLDLLQPSLL